MSKAKRQNRSRFLQRLRVFGKREDGTTAVEFAMLAMPLCYLLFGTIEFGIAMMYQSMLESATIDSSRLGRTGYSGSNISREQTLLNSIQSRLHNMLDMSQVKITSKAYTSYDVIGKPEPWTDKNKNGVVDPGEYTDINGNGKYDTDMGQAGYGGPKDVVVYTVTYPWPVMTPIVASFFTGGVFQMTSVAVVKNEPY